MNYLRQKVQERLKACGCECRFVSVAHLRDLEGEIAARHRAGELDEAFFCEDLGSFTFQLPADLPGARSIIVLAIPQPSVRVTFLWKGRITHSFVPPTYDTSVNAYAEDILARTLEPDGYRVARSVIPLKLLAVRSGLAVYGKNNICYVQGMGSFLRLAAFYTDLPPGEDVWLDHGLLDRCNRCSACVANCPTKAIDPERFLLHAERCLTFLNEHSGDFPSWVDPSWHQCPVGCMLCQNTCPENRHAANWIEKGPTFSEEETRLLLEGTPRSQLPELTVGKLEQLCLMEYIDLLPRNLKALLDRVNGPPMRARKPPASGRAASA